MNHLTFEFKNARRFLDEKTHATFLKKAEIAYDILLSGKGQGNDFLGWLDLPGSTSMELMNELNRTAIHLSSKAAVIVVIGIGGSYLGAKALIDTLGDSFSDGSKKGGAQIVFAGNNISEDYHFHLLNYLKNKEFAVIVISKSGTTTEPGIAFRLLKEAVEKKYGKADSFNRIVAITDKSRGALKKLADESGYASFVIPDDVGGRFSVLTPVGLLPIASAGYSIDSLMDGARSMQKVCNSTSDNPAIQYATYRNALYAAGNKVELLVNYEPRLHFISEWWKQLFGESEGKNGKGIFPASVDFTSDLHSMGQYVQDGERMLFETVLSVENPDHELRVPFDERNLDQLNYISGKRLSEVNRVAELGTLNAHLDGEVPNIRILLPGIDEYTLGQLIYFFEFSCGVSAYMLGVNPFDQPGVEVYKNNMFTLLGKPGHTIDQTGKFSHS